MQLASTKWNLSRGCDRRKFDFIFVFRERTNNFLAGKRLSVEMIAAHCPWHRRKLHRMILINFLLPLRCRFSRLSPKMSGRNGKLSFADEHYLRPQTMSVCRSASAPPATSKSLAGTMMKTKKKKRRRKCRD